MIKKDIILILAVLMPFVIPWIQVKLMERNARKRRQEKIDFLLKDFLFKDVNLKEEE
jgi:hypothetical protein